MDITTLLIILGGIYLVFMVIAGFFLIRNVYKHKVVAIYEVDGATQQKEFSARERIKDGEKEWKLLNPFVFKSKKGTFKAPPNYAKLIKGRGYVSYAFVTDEDEIIWAKRSKYDIEPLIDPVMTKYYKEQIRRAQAEKSKPLLQTIIPIGALFILGIVIVFGIIFWKDLAEPVLEADRMVGDIVASQEAITASLERIHNDVQQIKREGTINTEDESIPD